MRVAIDSAGRLVIPKAVRDELGITDTTELDVQARDGLIELAVVDVPSHVEDRPGGVVIVPESPVEPLTVEQVRAAIDRGRR